MGTEPVVQIVPALSPGTNGLGDYALCLARKLREKFGINSHFIVGDPGWKGASEVEGFTAQKVPSRTGEAVFSVLSGCHGPVLLHYVGYGYAKRGCPFWLVEGLGEWKKKAAKARLTTMFHELYATGPIWGSAFWLSSLQKTLAVELILLSDFCMTSIQKYSDTMLCLHKKSHQEVSVLPVFSNVGEPLPISLLPVRKPCLVVFGAQRRRRAVYSKHFGKLADACRCLGIKTILDIGPSLESPLPVTDGLQVRTLGLLPERKVSEIMATSLAGFLDYDPDEIGKSSIFAAYCAHGLLPINSKTSEGIYDGLKVGEHYWVPVAGASISLEKAQDIAENAHRWYQRHNLSVHAEATATACCSPCGAKVEKMGNQA